MRAILFLLLVLSGCATVQQVSPPLTAAGYTKRVVEQETVHLLEVNLNTHHVRPVKAPGLSTTSALAEKHGAVAAINGGFFQADGTPASVLVIDKQVLGFQSKPRAALGWSKDGASVLADRLTVTKTLPTFTSATGWTTSPQWEQLEFVVGGTPLLIHEFRILTDFASERVREHFLTLKHARSAICVRDSQQWVLVVVEGSSSLDSLFSKRSGFTMSELADFMHKELKCRFAINLDGGGSSTLVIDNVVVNKTTFGERSVSDAIGVFLKP